MTTKQRVIKALLVEQYIRRHMLKNSTTTKKDELEVQDIMCEALEQMLKKDNIPLPKL